MYYYDPYSFQFCAGYQNDYKPKDGLPIVVWEKPLSNISASPYWYLHVPLDVQNIILQQIAEKSMLVRVLIELWGEGESWKHVQSQVDTYEHQKRAVFSAPDQSFRFVMEAWGRSLGMEEKKKLVDSFYKCTRFDGKVDLKHAMHTWWAIEVGENYDANLPKLPPWFFFGREVAVNSSRQEKMRRLDLKSRRYLGPTSMPPELGNIMCSAASLRKSAIAFDPFVGTGSILLAAAENGAHTMGTDIDMRVIKLGKRDKRTGEQLNPWTNFKDYGLELPVGLLRADLHRLPFRRNLTEWFDAILADPPYGVRAGGRKSKSIPDIKIENRANHIASTSPYQLGECLRDLVEFSAR